MDFTIHEIAIEIQNYSTHAQKVHKRTQINVTHGRRACIGTQKLCYWHSKSMQRNSKQGNSCSKSMQRLSYQGNSCSKSTHRNTKNMLLMLEECAKDLRLRKLHNKEFTLKEQTQKLIIWITRVYSAHIEILKTDSCIVAVGEIKNMLTNS